MRNEYIIQVKPSEVNFAPASVLEEIFQNVNTIVTTMVTTVPYDREFGLHATFLDDPIPAARAKQIAEIMEKVEYHEPRVYVENVRFTQDHADGRLFPVLEISIRDGVKL